MRWMIGSLLSFLYNSFISHIPSRLLRDVFLCFYLKHKGSGTGIQMRCRFLNGRKVSFGERNVINWGCVFDGRKYKIVTGHDVSIGPCATILTLGHDPRSSTFADKGGEVLIGDYVWIGYGALILPGVKIGEGAVVAAGAVVTKDIEPYTIVAGNPARKIGDRPRDLSYRLNFKPFLA